MKFLPLVLFGVIVCSCSQKKTAKIERNELLNISKYQMASLDTISLKLHKKVDKQNTESIKLWKSYGYVQTWLNEHEGISAKEILNGTEELIKLSDKLKDSLTIKSLKTSGMITRINTFHSEVLRLKDMNEIPSISDMEVKQQAYKVYDVFDIITLKINAIYAQQRFESNLEFDEEFFKEDTDAIKGDK